MNEGMRERKKERKKKERTFIHISQYILTLKKIYFQKLILIRMIKQFFFHKNRCAFDNLKWIKLQCLSIENECMGVQGQYNLVTRWSRDHRNGY